MSELEKKLKEMKKPKPDDISSKTGEEVKIMEPVKDSDGDVDLSDEEPAPISTVVDTPDEPDDSPDDDQDDEKDFFEMLGDW